jgi:hypothetical protein
MAIWQRSKGFMPRRHFAVKLSLCNPSVGISRHGARLGVTLNVWRSKCEATRQLFMSWQPGSVLGMPRDRAQGQHIATYDEAIVYLTFVFGSSPLSPHRLARRLLTTGIAETVSSPADRKVRMSPHYDNQGPGKVGLLV